MIKAYVDAPVIAYKTFLVSCYVTDEDGNQIDMNDVLEDIQSRYPYDKTHDHAH